MGEHNENTSKGPAVNAQWIYDSPVHSDVETKLRQFLIELGNANKILGVQVCAYKDGEVIIDTAAGVLGKDNPSPVRPDSLFNVFSISKSITAGILHWLVDTGKVKLEDNVAKIWPEFGSNGKDTIKVHHVLNHTAGLPNALASEARENPQLLANYDECLRLIAKSTPETEPGRVQLYHYQTYGWLCGGIIEHASGKKIQELVDEVLVHPLNVEGELYLGIPPGVESRLAELMVDEDEIKALSGTSNPPDLPSSFDFVHLIMTLPILHNTHEFRRAIIPQSNVHCSARALARYYAALVDTGLVPPPHSKSSKPPLGGHTHFPNGTTSSTRQDQKVSKIFDNPRIHDQFLGFGEYENFALQDREYGLGFRKIRSEDGSVIGFGHAGLGGFMAYGDFKNKFAIVVNVNKLSLGAVTGDIIQLVCSELNILVPKRLKPQEENHDGRLEMERPVIN